MPGLAAVLDEDFGGQAGAARRGDKLDSQKFRLHGGDAAGVTGRGSGGVNRLVFRIDVGHGALQDDAHRRWRGAEDGLPADSRASIRDAGEARKGKLRSGGVSRGECFVVETEAYVSGRERERGSYVLIGWHLGSLRVA